MAAGTPPERNPRNPDLRPSEDDLARASLGIRGVPGATPTPITPGREIKTPPGKRPPDGSVPPEHTA